MIIKFDAAESVASELDKNGRVTLFLCFSDWGPLDPAMLQAIDAWADPSQTEEICLYPQFRLDSALNDVINLHEQGEGGPIDSDARPLLNAMREELLAMVARIDALRFAD